MASRLNPFISFDGTAKKAMEFYQAVLGGELTSNTYGELSADHGDDADKIMYSMLETPDGFTLMASDTPAGVDYKPGTNITISLSGDDDDNLRGWFEKLADGGQITVPLEKQLWGDEFGMLVDKFGIGWLVNIAGEDNKG
ncbi:VOC family protein [Luteipulveratus halotolerans]|uniref:3-demethylubiquinone-9 3-methyltransferase n=1 Tax=Luteipulveratus halotolerans TaxID=1631356 RepID=A0A0L6CLJ9_9MICO|nr:VOC family protein [Luteipulveratus halotolerans]KNX38622.1 3-demethylubiquinone-9 3-methyltransferase [Luteipulveratus halotolerans]